MRRGLISLGKGRVTRQKKEEKKAEESKEGEENVISPEEFEELEKKEKKKFKIFSRKKKKEKKEEAKPSEPSAGGEPLILQVEKLEGKLEALNSEIEMVNERMGHMSEEIGELRTSIMEEDRSFRKIESGFEKVIASVETIEPEKFASKLEGAKTDVVKNTASIESLTLKAKELEKTILSLKDVLDKVKSIENLVRVSKTIKKDLEKMEASKNYINKTTGKIETIFTEQMNRLRELESLQKKIDSNSETIYELLKSIDAMDAKSSKFVQKQELENVVDSMTDTRIEYEDKVQDMKEVVTKLISIVENIQKTPKTEKIVFRVKEKEVPEEEELERIEEESEKEKRKTEEEPGAFRISLKKILKKKRR